MAKKNQRQLKKQQKSPAMMREDSYQNIFMNVGNAGDRSNYSNIKCWRLLDSVTLSNVYLGDGLGRRIVDIVAEEMFRAGFHVDGASNEPEIHSRWDELNLTQHFTDAIAWSRLYGGAIVFFGVNDGRDITEPLGDGRLEFVKVFDRFTISPGLKDINPSSKTYGQYITWRVHSSDKVWHDIHASRCHIFDGERLPESMRRDNHGWGMSCLQGVYNAMVDFGMSHKHTTSLLERKQQAVWKYKRLSEVCQDEEGSAAVLKRVNLVDMTRSINNMVAIDAEDEAFELLSGDLTGVVDVVDRKKQLICALTGIPESILFGTRPSGMNADDSQVPESWKQLIGRKQKDEARPAIEKAISLLTDDKTWTIKFNPLSVPSDKEQSTTDQAQSQADTAYLDAGVLSQSELRETLRKRGRYVMTDEDSIDDTPEEENEGLAIPGGGGEGLPEGDNTTPQNA